MRAELDVTYNNAPFAAPEQAGAEIESLTCTDKAGGESDSVEITLDAQDEKWVWDWMPEKGAELHPRILLYNWLELNDGYTLDCGLFTLNEVNYSDTPTTISVSGTSKPADTDFSEQEREAVWQNTSVKRIGETIAGRYGLGFSYDAEDFDIDCDEQEATDGSYYNELCKRYGLTLKIYAKRMWVYDREAYKEKPEAATFDRTGILRGSMQYRTELSGTFTGGTFTYTDEDRDVDIVCSVGGGPRMKNISRRAASVQDASVQLCAELNEANHGMTTLSFSVPGVWNVSAGNNIRLTGYGKLDGRYFVDSVTHKVSRSGGFTSDFSCSAIVPGFRHWDVGGSIQQHETESGKMTGAAAGAASTAAKEKEKNGGGGGARVPPSYSMK